MTPEFKNSTDIRLLHPESLKWKAHTNEQNDDSGNSSFSLLFFFSMLNLQYKTYPVDSCVICSHLKSHTHGQQLTSCTNNPTQLTNYYQLPPSNEASLEYFWEEKIILKDIRGWQYAINTCTLNWKFYVPPYAAKWTVAL